jgi:hypothetical protein
MRTYALYGRSKIILAFMLSVTFAAIGFAVVSGSALILSPPVAHK